MSKGRFVCDPFFFVFSGRRMVAAARVTGASTYNFVQGSEKFVHPSTTIKQEHTTVIQPSAKRCICRRWRYFCFIYEFEGDSSMKFNVYWRLCLQKTACCSIINVGKVLIYKAFCQSGQDGEWLQRWNDWLTWICSKSAQCCPFFYKIEQQNKISSGRLTPMRLAAMATVQKSLLHLLL